ncbi:MAG: hypothetical protein ACREF4_11875, partial [Gammaproteobacteria bacterium]
KGSARMAGAIRLGELTHTMESRIEAAIAAVREAAKGDQGDAIRRATEELQKASHAMAEQLYKSSQANAAGAAASHNQGDDVREGEVVDA